jgi:Tol biopolymer transport system component
MQFDIWKFPVGSDPKSNVAHAIKITHQTAKVLTPSVSPDDRQMVYLSDSGGAGDLWVMDLQTGDSTQITSLKEDSTVGIPLWSPDGKNIAFAVTSRTRSWRDVDYWLVNPDGSNQRLIVHHGSWASWSPDSKWLYYTNVSPITPTNNAPSAYKSPVQGGDPVLIRNERVTGITVAPDGKAIYFVRPVRGGNGAQDYLLCVASPENSESRTLLHMSNTQVPTWQGPHPAVSPDGKSLAVLLNDDLGTNIWLASTEDGSLKRVTDFGDRRTYIARRVSFSSDGHYIFASVGEGDSDIVPMSGLLQ